MKTSILALVTLVTLPCLAHAEAKPQQVVGSMIAACPVGAAAGAAVGAVTTRKSEGALKGAGWGCGGSMMFVGGIGIANAGENEPDEKVLNKDDANATEEESQ
jgi:predicted MFS family arabinose efflux permease